MTKRLVKQAEVDLQTWTLFSPSWLLDFQEILKFSTRQNKLAC